jgi:hypothetical protein
MLGRSGVTARDHPVFGMDAAGGPLPKPYSAERMDLASRMPIPNRNARLTWQDRWRARSVRVFHRMYRYSPPYPEQSST